MALKRTPRPRDPVQLGKLMVDIATGAVPDAVEDGKDDAVKGRAGGRSRAANLTADQRAEIARKAAKTRWKANVDG
jgi:hypothetical protein